MDRPVIINEDSPLTLEGSFTRDLIFSKFWLCHELMNVVGNGSMDTVVVLGSWYGNMALILGQYGLAFERMFLVDKDPGCNMIARKILRNAEGVSVVTADANLLRYPPVSRSMLVINTSCNDMGQGEWYTRIPTGTLVALQSRSDHEDLGSFDRSYPMSDTRYLGSRKFKDPGETYLRHMKLGFR